MPVIKSAIKKMRQDLKRRRANHLKKERLGALIKRAKKEVTEKNIQAAISLIDRAVKAKIIHKKRGAHLKSRLSKLLSLKRPKGEEGQKIGRKKAKPRPKKSSSAKKAS